MQMDFRTPPPSMRAFRLIVGSILLNATINNVGAGTVWRLDKIRIGVGAFSPTNTVLLKEAALLGDPDRAGRFHQAFV